MKQRKNKKPRKRVKSTKKSMKLGRRENDWIAEIGIWNGNESGNEENVITIGNPFSASHYLYRTTLFFGPVKKTKINLTSYFFLLVQNHSFVVIQGIPWPWVLKGYNAVDSFFNDKNWRKKREKLLNEKYVDILAVPCRYGRFNGLDCLAWAEGSLAVALERSIDLVITILAHTWSAPV